MEISLEDLFTYHKPFGNQTERYEQIRDKAFVAAVTVNDLCPDSREKTIAIRKLQEAVMWANASIAINEKEGEDDGEKAEG